MLGRELTARLLPSIRIFDVIVIVGCYADCLQVPRSDVEYASTNPA